jgi:hypothetical protein
MDKDQKLLATAQGSYEKQQADITKRQMATMSERYKMYLMRAIPVYAPDGTVTFSNSMEINKNPGQFAPLSGALQVKQKTALFKEIDATVGMVNNAIDKLPDTAFDASSRAQIALVMKDEHPLSAWQNFVRSGFATTLTDEQVAYVTTLSSLQESSMAMRSIQGMGAGSDMLRGAILNMLPGAGTPSKSWAKQQMKIFKVEVDSLRTALPNLPETRGGGAGTAPPAGGVATHRFNPSSGKIEAIGAKP